MREKHWKGLDWKSRGGLHGGPGQGAERAIWSPEDSEC